MLTESGIAVTMATLILFAVGWAADYPELVALAFAGLAVLLMAVPWMLARPDLTAVREIRPHRVSVGEPAFGVLTVTNKASRRSPPIVVVEAVAATRLSIPVPSLASSEPHRVSYPLSTWQRGIYQVGPLTVGHTDPLRLMRVGREYETWSTLVVYPKVHPVESVPTGRTRDMDGPTSGIAPQGGIAFHSLREYESGDDWRLIHWKSTARMGALMVRHNIIPHEPRLMVVLDTSVNPYSERSFEEAVSAAASLCVAAIRGGFPLEFRTTAGAAVVADRVGEGVGAALDLLAAVQRSAEDQGLAALSGIVPPDGGVSLGVVTGQPCTELLAAVPAVRPRFLMVSLIQFAEELTAPSASLPGVVAVKVRNGAEFAASWNHLVRR